MNFITPAFAEATTAAQPSALSGFIPMLLIFVVFYFLLIRPQQKKVKQHNEMIKNIKKGDVVVTSGGIIGKVEKILDAGEAYVQIADNVTITVITSTLANVIDKKFSMLNSAVENKKKAPVKKKAATKKNNK